MAHSARLLIPVTLATVALFQAHWLDDVGTADPDAAGILVSLIGTVLLLAGLAGRARRWGRILLAGGFLFVAFVSAADLSGLNEEGTFADDVVAHWRETLGWPMTVAIALTFALCLVGAWLLNVTAAHPRAQPVGRK